MVIGGLFENSVSVSISPLKCVCELGPLFVNVYSSNARNKKNTLYFLHTYIFQKVHFRLHDLMTRKLVFEKDTILRTWAKLN